jgi:7-keto-8-aminopelargonate synthetase-like enzyme/acyl-CoA synthetase (AMP-forming)/AMP-acid ligase II
MVGETLLTILFRAAEQRGAEPIFRYLLSGEAAGPAQTLSAAELYDDALAVAGALRTFGIESADAAPRAIIACQSPVEFAQAFFGALCGSFLPVPADIPSPRLGADTLQALRAVVTDARPSLLIADTETICAIRRVSPSFERDESGCRMATVQELIAKNEKSNWRSCSPTQLAFLQYTSGSTSSPRGVMVTHENVVSNLYAIRRTLSPPPDAVGVCWLPLSHDLGLVGNFLLALFAESGQLVMLSPFDFARRPVRWLEAISHFQAWGTSAPNFAFDLCERATKKEQAERLQLSSLESVLCGAEPIDAETLERFSRRFEPHGFRRDRLRPCYGLAEATLFVSAARSITSKTFDAAALTMGRLEESSSESKRCMVSCGVVQEDLHVAIVDPYTARNLREGEIGEIWISGSSVAAGYFGFEEEMNESLFRASLAGEDRRYLRSGDIGAFYGGELYISGRRKDVLVVRGRNYQAHDVEVAAAAAHPKLAGVRVAAFSEFGRAETVTILAESFAASESEWRTIARHIRSRVGAEFGILPGKVVIVPAKSVAVTRTGKIRRDETRRQYEAGVITALFTDVLDSSVVVASDAPKDDWVKTRFEQAVLNEIRHTEWGRDCTELAPDVRLSELGIDSLGMAQLGDALAAFIDASALPSMLEDDPTLSTLLMRIRQWNRAGESPLPVRRDLAPALDIFEPARRFLLPDRMREMGLLPFYQPFTDWKGTHASLNGRRILILSSFDYLGLSNRPEVREAAASAARHQGTGRSSSRVHSATSPEVLALEEKLARFLERQDALICTTGYQALSGVVASFMNTRTTLVVDEQIHASILDGAAIARCRVQRFRHNDVQDLEGILSKTQSVLVIVEGLYSNSGDIAPLPKIREISSRYGARVALDEAHALGVLGLTGRGTEEHFQSIGACDIVAGTFSKSLVSIGGWIAGDREVIEYIRYHARPVLFTAGISPPMLAAASAALDILITQPEIVERLRHNSAWLLSELQRCGVPVTSQGPIFGLPISNDEVCVRLSAELLRRGIYVHTVLYPSVPRHAALLRLCVSAAHDSADLSHAAEELGECWGMMRTGEFTQPISLPQSV